MMIKYFWISALFIVAFKSYHSNCQEFETVPDIYFHNPRGMFKRFTGDNQYNGKYCDNSPVDDLASTAPAGVGPCFGDWPVEPKWEYTENTSPKAQGTVYGTYACHDWLQCWNNIPNGVGRPSHPFVVAMPSKYTGKPGDSSFRGTPADRCFKCVAVEVVHANGTTYRAVLEVTDCCPECDDAHIDMSSFSLQYLSDPSLANPGGPGSPQKFRWGWYDCGHNLRPENPQPPPTSTSTSTSTTTTATSSSSTTKPTTSSTTTKPTTTTSSTTKTTSTTTTTTTSPSSGPDFSNMKLGQVVVTTPLSRKGDLMMSGALESNNLLGCGYKNIDSSVKPWLVGLSVENSCGKCIVVQANDMAIKGVVVEKIGSGGSDAIVLTPETMNYISPDTGYVPDVSWDFVSCE